MNFSEIETLVAGCKLGHNDAKEALITEFTPFILNLIKKSYVNHFEFEDLKNECYKTLFKCVKLYDLEKHRFVAYATNAIKNTINYLIRSASNTTKNIPTLALSLNLEQKLPSKENSIEDEILREISITEIKKIITTLTFEEKELINFIYYKNHSLKQYAEYKGLSYGKAVTMKNNILKNLKAMINSN